MRNSSRFRASFVGFREVHDERNSGDSTVITWDCAHRAGFSFAPISHFAEEEVTGKSSVYLCYPRRWHRQTAGRAKTLLCNNNDLHLRPMCIIFDMIERNVACCHACLRHRGKREIAHLQGASPRVERKAKKRFGCWRTILHQTTVLGTRLLLSPLRSASPLLITPFLS